MENSVGLNSLTPHCQVDCLHSEESPAVMGGRGTHSPCAPGPLVQVTLDVAAVITETSAGQPSVGEQQSQERRRSCGGLFLG